MGLCIQIPQLLFSSKVHMPGPQEFIINYRGCPHCVKFSGCRRSNISCTWFSRSIAMCPFQVTANCIKILTGTSYLIGMAFPLPAFQSDKCQKFWSFVYQSVPSEAWRQAIIPGSTGLCDAFWDNTCSAEASKTHRVKHRGKV